MKKLYTTKTILNISYAKTIVFAGILLLFVSNSYAQVAVDFTPRTSVNTPSKTIYTIQGDFTMIGNTNLTLQNYSDDGNNNLPMEFVDRDDVVFPGNAFNTINSSSATLALSTENRADPGCSKIIYAGIYWTGRVDQGVDANADGDNNPYTFNVIKDGVTKPLDKRKIRIKGPEASVYTEFTAEPANNILFPQDIYRNIFTGYTEITDYVQLNGIGEYFVGDLPGREGYLDDTGLSSGWGMVVVYENSKMKWRDVTVFDGYAFVRSNPDNIVSTIPVSGFNAAQSGDVNLKLGVMGGEGERGFTGDYFSIERLNSGVHIPLSHTANAPDNFFTGTILTDGNTRNPDLINNTGIDIAMFNVDNTGNTIIANGQTQTSFEYSTFQDTYTIFNVTFAVDAYVPEPEGVLNITSINGNSPNPPDIIEPGQSSEYILEIRNTGTEATDNTVITIPIPETIDPSNLNITIGFPNPGTFTTTNIPTYSTGPGLGPNGSIVWDLGTLPAPPSSEDVLATISFSLTVTRDCNMLTDPSFDPNVSLSGTITGVGAVSNVPFDFPLIQGYETTGNCAGEPIPTPILIGIDYLDYVNEPPVITAPSPIVIEGCDENNITALTSRYPYSASQSNDIKDTYVTTGYTASDNGSIESITYIDVITPNSSCPMVVTRTYTATDDCGNSTSVDQTINISPATITYTNPSDDNAVSCDFADQTQVDTAFNDWITAQTAAIAPANGCAPILSNNSGTLSAPDICDGGAITVTWAINDICETINNITATYILTPAAAISFTSPANDSSTAAEFDDPDPTVAQANLDADIAAWVQAQTATINSSIDDGCSPEIRNNFTDQSITFCSSGSITITWTIEDLCETLTPSATYSFAQPDGINFTDPAGKIANSCDFDDDDPAMAQANLDADIAAWVQAQTDIINGSLTGGSPEVSHNFTNQSIDLCGGGDLTVTWTINDICETQMPSATYILTPAAAISFTSPANDSSTAAEFDDPDPTVAQANLDADIAAWVQAQTATINSSIADGCSPEIRNNFTDQSITFCSSGSITITWTIEDLCETLTPSATYSFAQPDGINFTDPAGKIANSCDFDDDDPAMAQANLDADIAAWVQAQTATINSSIDDGCSPEMTNNFTDQSIAFCSSGSITITWTIEDLCETLTPSATYSFAQPDGINFTDPAGKIANSCDFDDDDPAMAQANLDADIAAWVQAQTDIINGSLTGGSPEVSHNFTNQSIDLCGGGDLTVTWSINDICETQMPSATYRLTPAAAISFTSPADDFSDACEFDDPDPAVAQANLDADIATWVQAQTAAISGSINGGCAPTITSNFVNQGIDFCIGGSITITWTIEDLCETRNQIANYTFTPPTATVFDQSILPQDETVECHLLTPAEDLTASNSCGEIDVVFTEDRTDGDCPNRYSLLRTWTATNTCGVSIAHTQIVTVTDNTAPVLTIPTNISAECSDDMSPTSFGNATATDNCDANPMVTFNDERTDGSCSGTYVITRTWTAIDACGNSSSANQILSISDTTVPEFVQTTLPGNITVECDAVPAIDDVVLTATDNCGTATVNVTDSINAGSCPNNYSINRTWVAIDECGLTTSHTQTITVQDTTRPEFVEDLPEDITVECNAVPNVTTLTATDNCGDAKVAVSDAITNGNCANNYTIARTWVATDACGLMTIHTQKITVQDTTAPVPTTTFEETLDVSCTEVPDAPELEFSDNCSVSAGITVVFKETNTFDETELLDYQIIRTWTVNDECANQEVYTQTLNVLLDEVLIDIVAPDLCFDEGAIDLNNFTPETLNTTGTWELLEGDSGATLTENIFDPTDIEWDANTVQTGINYRFRYTTTDQGCISITEIVLTVNYCEVLPCGENDIVISKALTPNGDGFNESFDISGIELCGFTANIRIFNRWGALVFESSNYQVGQGAGGWRGSSPKSSIGNNGKLPNGTYYYIINLENSGLKPLTGPIYLGTK